MVAFAAAALVIGMASCKGRTQENMTPNGDTVENINIEVPDGLDSSATESGGEVVMNDNPQTGVIADSPAEAAAQAGEQTKADAAAAADANTQADNSKAQ